MPLCDAHPDMTARLDRIERKQDQGFERLESLMADSRAALAEEQQELLEKIEADRETMQVQIDGARAAAGGAVSWRERAIAFIAGAVWLAGIGFTAWKAIP